LSFRRKSIKDRILLVLLDVKQVPGTNQVLHHLVSTNRST